jgi:ribosomal RNA-processing protein 7
MYLSSVVRCPKHLSQPTSTRAHFRIFTQSDHQVAHLPLKCDRLTSALRTFSTIMPTTPAPNLITGFSVLPVAYTSSATHFLYARMHHGHKRAKIAMGDGFPDSRTLFLVNVPPDATEREIFLLFKHCGTVERVSFQGTSEKHSTEDQDSSSSNDEMSSDEEQEPRPRPPKKRKIAEEAPPEVQYLPSASVRPLLSTGHSAYVVFLDSSSAERALSSSSFPSSKLRRWPTSPEPSGLAHYTAKYTTQRPALDIVKLHADTFMRRFEYDLAKKKAAAKSQYRKGEAIVDEDGFTLVTRGGAYGQTLGGGVGVASRRFQENAAATHTDQKRGRGRKKKESKEKEGFYAFQKHEKKRSGKPPLSDHSVLADVNDIQNCWS